MSQTIRSFIAIELPDAVISWLETVQQDLRSLRLRARWVRPQNIHLTLKFLGNTPPGDIEKIGSAMTDAAAAGVPFKLTVGGIGVFPGLKHPRVIWTGLAGDMKVLLGLQRNLEDRLAAIGFPKEKRSYKPHLTLGRIRETVNSAAIRQIVQQYSDLGRLEFTSDRIILFKSDLKPSGAVYSKLKQADLRKMKNEY